MDGTARGSVLLRVAFGVTVAGALILGGGAATAQEAPVQSDPPDGQVTCGLLMLGCGERTGVRSAESDDPSDEDSSDDAPDLGTGGLLDWLSGDADTDTDDDREDDDSDGSDDSATEEEGPAGTTTGVAATPQARDGSATRTAETAPAAQTGRDSGAGAALARAMLPGVGDSVAGRSGLDLTGTLTPPTTSVPGEPPTPRPPPVVPPSTDALTAAMPPTPPVTTDAAARSFIEGLAGPGGVGWDVSAILPSLLLTMLLLAGLTLPTGPLNRAAEDHPDRLRLVADRLQVPPAALGNAPRAVAAAVGVTAVAAAVLLGFLAPAFPFDGSAAPLMLGLVLALVLVTAAQQGSRLLYVGRFWGVRCTLTPFPGILLFAAAAVVLSRLAGLEPGLIFGTLVAFGTARPLRTDEDGPATALAAGALTALAALAWLVREPLVMAAGAPIGFLPSLLGTALTAASVAAVTNLVLMLVPFGFQPGAALLRWSPGLWAMFACVSGFAFVHVVLPTGAGFLWRVAVLGALLAVYLLAAAAFWWWMRREPATSLRTEPPTEPTRTTEGALTHPR